METTISLPDIGDFTEVEIIEVHVSDGAQVEENDPVITIETDKASMDVPAGATGVITKLLVKAGDKISEGGAIALLDGAGETISSPAPEPPTAAPSTPEPAPAPAPAPAVSEPAPAVTKVHAGPAVRRLAKELDVDLTTIKGSGHGGRVVRQDVLDAFKPASESAGSGMAAIPAVPIPDFSKFGSIETVDLPRIKQISGPALHRSWLNVPHVTHNDESDITDLEAYRKELDSVAREEGYRVTLLAFLMKGVVSALRVYPEVNSSLSGTGQLVLKRYYNIGVAVDTPGGLVVPVVKDVASKGVREISQELGALSAKAREGKLAATDIQGATFTISSLGGIGGTSFTPIVNAPEVAILGVVRSAIKPSWNGEEFVPRLMLPLSLSYDHRVVDGALAARFTRHVAHVLEDVRRLVL